ncbi:MAG: hypothetical protein WBL58_05290 [Peptococcia bacterium]
MVEDKKFQNRAGRKVRIVLYEVDSVSGKEFPLIDTRNNEAKYRRPAQAIYDFVWKTYELDLANDAMYFLPSWHYLVFKQNDIDNIKKMWNQMIERFK